MFNQNQKNNGNRNWNGNNNGKPWFSKKKFWNKNKNNVAVNSDSASSADENHRQFNNTAKTNNHRNKDDYDNDQNVLRTKIHGELADFNLIEYKMKIIPTRIEGKNDDEFCYMDGVEDMTNCEFENWYMYFPKESELSFWLERNNQK